MDNHAVLSRIEKLQQSIEPIVSELTDCVRPPSRTDLHTVNLICGSSRCGSSWLFRYLSQSPFLASPRGEQVPFEKLYLFSKLVHRKTDRLDAEDAHPALADRIFRLLSLDLGHGPTTTDADADYDCLLQIRLLLQFPKTLTPDVIYKELKSCPPGIRRFGELLRRLAAKRLVRSEYYDNDPAFYPGNNQVSSGPPDDELALEETPFVPILPRKRPPAGLPLVLKSSLHAYRLPFMQRFFPKSRLRLILLSRNPTASINGLMEGWQSRVGFYSYNVSLFGWKLSLRGYSEMHPFGKQWWKFDLPPIEKELLSASLASVCAHQWTSSYAHILDFVDHHKEVSVFQLRYEELIQGQQRRQKVLGALAEFLEIPALFAGNGMLPDGVIMATQQPQPGRWKRRFGEIIPLLRQPALRQVCERLGYEQSEVASWI